MCGSLSPLLFLTRRAQFKAAIPIIVVLIVARYSCYLNVNSTNLIATVSSFQWCVICCSPTRTCAYSYIQPYNDNMVIVSRYIELSRNIFVPTKTTFWTNQYSSRNQKLKNIYHLTTTIQSHVIFLVYYRERDKKIAKDAVKAALKDQKEAHDEAMEKWVDGHKLATIRLHYPDQTLPRLLDYHIIQWRESLLHLLQRCLARPSYSVPAGPPSGGNSPGGNSPTTSSQPAAAGYFHTMSLNESQVEKDLVQRPDDPVIEQGLCAAPIFRRLQRTWWSQRTSLSHGSKVAPHPRVHSGSISP